MSNRYGGYYSPYRRTTSPSFSSQFNSLSFGSPSSYRPSAALASPTSSIANKYQSAVNASKNTGSTSGYDYRKPATPGYTSDHSKSSNVSDTVHASGHTSDNKKSFMPKANGGYASDASRSGYASDAKGSHNNDYGRIQNGSYDRSPSCSRSVYNSYKPPIGDKCTSPYSSKTNLTRPDPVSSQRDKSPNRGGYQRQASFSQRQCQRQDSGGSREQKTANFGSRTNLQKQDSNGEQSRYDNPKDYQSAYFGNRPPLQRQGSVGERAILVGTPAQSFPQRQDSALGKYNQKNERITGYGFPRRGKSLNGSERSEISLPSPFNRDYKSALSSSDVPPRRGNTVNCSGGYQSDRSIGASQSRSPSPFARQSSCEASRLGSELSSVTQAIQQFSLAPKPTLPPSWRPSTTFQPFETPYRRIYYVPPNWSPYNGLSRVSSYKTPEPKPNLAPADFSNSESEESDSDDEEKIEYLVCRSTSPSTTNRPEDENMISSIGRLQKPAKKRFPVGKLCASVQVESQDIKKAFAPNLKIQFPEKTTQSKASPTDTVPAYAYYGKFSTATTPSAASITANNKLSRPIPGQSPQSSPTSPKKITEPQWPPQTAISRKSASPDANSEGKRPSREIRSRKNKDEIRENRKSYEDSNEGRKSREDTRENQKSKEHVYETATNETIEYEKQQLANTNKDFRKSVLNMNLTEKEREEYLKMQKAKRKALRRAGKPMEKESDTEILQSSTEDSECEGSSRREVFKSHSQRSIHKHDVKRTSSSSCLKGDSESSSNEEEEDHSQVRRAFRRKRFSRGNTLEDRAPSPQELQSVDRLQELGDSLKEKAPLARAEDDTECEEELQGDFEMVDEAIIRTPSTPKTQQEEQEKASSTSESGSYGIEKSATVVFKGSNDTQATTDHNTISRPAFIKIPSLNRPQDVVYSLKKSESSPRVEDREFVGSVELTVPLLIQKSHSAETVTNNARQTDIQRSSSSQAQLHPDFAQEPPGLARSSEIINTTKLKENDLKVQKFKYQSKPLYNRTPSSGTGIVSSDRSDPCNNKVEKPKITLWQESEPVPFLLRTPRPYKSIYKRQSATDTESEVYENIQFNHALLPKKPAQILRLQQEGDVSSSDYEVVGIPARRKELVKRRSREGNDESRPKGTSPFSEHKSRPNSIVQQDNQSSQPTISKTEADLLQYLEQQKEQMRRKAEEHHRHPSQKQRPRSEDVAKASKAVMSNPPQIEIDKEGNAPFQQSQRSSSFRSDRSSSESRPCWVIHQEVQGMASSIPQTARTGSPNEQSITSGPFKQNDVQRFNVALSADTSVAHASLQTNQQKHQKSNQTPRAPRRQDASVRKGKSQFIGTFKDIDSFLEFCDSDSFDAMETKFDNETLQNVESLSQIKKSSSRPQINRPSSFIGNLVDIDDILGPESPSMCPFEKGQDAMSFFKIEASQVKVHGPKDSMKSELLPKIEEYDSSAIRIREVPKGQGIVSKVDDSCLQLYRHSEEAGTYLDLDSSIEQQRDEFAAFEREDASIVLRSQLPVRVHAIIEKLMNSNGRDLRRALFALKQVFQDDKDLVHAFVENRGLDVLVKIGQNSDHNYQNYILRALGQIMLYVDGMHGVIRHNQTIQWLYLLTQSNYRLVVKAALKLLLVFFEYTDTNCLQLLRAMYRVQQTHGLKPWASVMKILSQRDNADMELLIFAMSLINKTLDGVPDQDTYYDIVDSLEEMGMERVVQFYLSKQGVDNELLQQLQLYENILRLEDGITTPNTKVPACVRNRKQNPSRKSRRHNPNDGPPTKVKPSPLLQNLIRSVEDTAFTDNDLTPAMRRWKDDHKMRDYLRDENDEPMDICEQGAQPSANVRQFKNIFEQTIQEQEAGDAPLRQEVPRRQLIDLSALHHAQENIPKIPEHQARNLASAGYQQQQQALAEKLSSYPPMRPPTSLDAPVIPSRQPPYAASQPSFRQRPPPISLGKVPPPNRNQFSNNLQKFNCFEKDSILQDMLWKSGSPVQWQDFIKSVRRPLFINDFDFTDLSEDDDVTVLNEDGVPFAVSGSTPPPPPPMEGLDGPPPPPFGVGFGGPPPPPPPPGAPPTFPPPFGARAPSQALFEAPPFGATGPRKTTPPFLQQKQHSSSQLPWASSKNEPGAQPTIQKSKKTVKLFWKEIKEDRMLLARIKKQHTIWDELCSEEIDTAKLEELFENKAKDLMKQKQEGKRNEITVLDAKRSNAINIGMTKLPNPRTIRAAILKMDSTVMNREGIEKILTTMIPSAEEMNKIVEAQMANPEVPLGNAENFLLTLSSITELEPRLRLWAFVLDYNILEKEVAEPLMDLKQAIAEIESNKTFRIILSTVLAIGNFLNGSPVKGFQLDYLAKIPEVKDTIYKHSLLFHVVEFVSARHPNSSDLYSEMAAVTRTSKVDFEETAKTLNKLETDCKASWEHLKAVAKHDGQQSLDMIASFLSDSAERITVLGVIYKRVINRFHKLMVFFGHPLYTIKDAKPHAICKIVSEFALEYRTTREKIREQNEKKRREAERANRISRRSVDSRGATPERASTLPRGVRGGSVKSERELTRLLSNGYSSDASDGDYRNWGSLGRRSRAGSVNQMSRHNSIKEGEYMSGADGDELIETLIRTASQAPSQRSLEKQRRVGAGERRSLRRALQGGDLCREERRNCPYMSS
ncbi:uncharacterized protein LOC111247031 [Varroa destructor]|uniref:FH1/FH2 domain-containing protein 3 n=1 Tax=Varroa destructor TaxID=109461 RepID=A0A7M7JJU6_VARDE|nr:uncharacterized protein LOC111247031 [Varroa destructor]